MSTPKRWETFRNRKCDAQMFDLARTPKGSKGLLQLRFHARECAVSRRKAKKGKHLVNTGLIVMSKNRRAPNLAAEH